MSSIDCRGFLPLDLKGGHAGLPCRRKLPALGMPKSVEMALRREAPLKDKDFKHDRSDNVGLMDAARASWLSDPFTKIQQASERRVIEQRAKEADADYIPFTGTRNMDWRVARSRSTGCLQPNGIVMTVLKKRNANEFEDLVAVLQAAMSREARKDLREFRQVHNKHRHVVDKTIADEANKRKVLRTLAKYPLVDLYDLVSCAPEEWTEISRELGGVNHGVAVRCALEHVQNHFAPVDRAAWWVAVRARQPAINQGRSTSFPGDNPLFDNVTDFD
eukprot:TRINITY_DN113915_c0_g1_i1.p1 TRINITY_DN113915_c0_g1~~TRINITY_DN113915_c0_g1_i1.p1  ORF type:complete len:275 (-),score=61.54 TRINITY_DN113915_c0_g1_i1:191-1015(-)